MASGSVWRIYASGRYTSTGVGSARNFLVQPYWGSTAMGVAFTVVNNVGGGLGTFTADWNLDLILIGTSTTLAKMAGQFRGFLDSSIALTVATYNSLAPTSSASVASSAQTLDLRFAMSAAVSGESWVVDVVTIERLA